MLQKYLSYLRDNPEKLWFKRKLYGWGWTPATWQGWLVIVVYVVLLIAFSLTIDDNSPPREIMFTFILPITLFTIALIRVCYRTWEKPKWSWGLPKKK